MRRREETRKERETTFCFSRRITASSPQTASNERPGRGASRAPLDTMLTRAAHARLPSNWHRRNGGPAPLPCGEATRRPSWAGPRLPRGLAIDLELSRLRCCAPVSHATPSCRTAVTINLSPQRDDTSPLHHARQYAFVDLATLCNPEWPKAVVANDILQYNTDPHDELPGFRIHFKNHTF